MNEETKGTDQVAVFLERIAVAAERILEESRLTRLAAQVTARETWRLHRGAFEESLAQLEANLSEDGKS